MHLTLVGRPAPDFTAAAVRADGEIVKALNLHATRAGRYALLFFYPMDFTFVCPSELIALDRRCREFEKRGVAIFAISVDSEYTHLAWRRTPVEEGGIGPVGYTLVADVPHRICRAYGIEHEADGVAYRGSFLIDRDGIVRHASINDLPLGRDIDELIRIVDALQFHEAHGEVCPAGWRPGLPGMRDTPEGVAEYLRQHAGSLAPT